jgi:hypothetical protein
MSGIIFKLTDAGRQALVNAEHDGTQARQLVSVGVTDVAFTPTELLATVPNEIKRIETIAGDVVAMDTIHVTIRDEGTDTYSVRGMGLYLDNGVLLGTYSQPGVIVEKSTSSILLMATDLRVLDGGADISTLLFGETNFINPPATTERQGVVELATSQETATGTDAMRAVTPAALKPLLEARQPLDATLTALAGVDTVADRLIYATGIDQFAVTPLTAFIRTLLDDADAATARNTLGAAPLASPGLTGTPTAPTAAVGTNTTQLATTAFVIGQAGTAAPKMDSAADVGTATRFAREDHVHPTDTTRAPLDSPGLTGTPTAPTAAPGTNTNQIATTAFVAGATENRFLQLSGGNRTVNDTTKFQVGQAQTQAVQIHGGWGSDGILRWAHITEADGSYGLYTYTWGPQRPILFGNNRTDIASEEVSIPRNLSTGTAIKVNNTFDNGSSTDGLRSYAPHAQGWEGWQTTGRAVIQVDCTDATSAFLGLRFTRWGSHHVGAIQALASATGTGTEVRLTSGELGVLALQGDGNLRVNGGVYSLNGARRLLWNDERQIVWGGVVEFAIIDNDVTVDLPTPYVMTGLRGGTGGAPLDFVYPRGRTISLT